jgi:hypothetical protein
MSWALQGLWAAPWLTDVAGLDHAAVVEHLTLMAAVLDASALLLGAVAERLRRAGISTEVFLVGTLCLSMAAQLALLLGVPVSSHLLRARRSPVPPRFLSFAILARYFPKELRAAPTPPSASSTWARPSACSVSPVSSSLCGRLPAVTTPRRRTRRPWTSASACS